MKVCIIGAGIAGLSCAIELEKHGVETVIIERNSFIGEQVRHVGALLDVFYKDYGDILEYLLDEFQITLKPLNTINTLVHNTPNGITTLKGNYGCMFKRSKDDDSIKGQLHSHLKNTKIIFSEYGDYQKLKNDYDYVVIATGGPDFTNELGCFNEVLKGHVKGAVITGHFDPNTLIMWMNIKYCKNGYAYLTPFNATKASLVLAVTDVTPKEIQHYWELFMNCENIRYNATEEFTLEHITGDVYPHKVDNIYFIGNAGGALGSLLGFGITSSILTGAMCGRAIGTGVEYKKLIKDVMQFKKQLNIFRLGFNKLSNREYERLTKIIALPGIKQIMYNSPLNIIRYGSKILELFEK